VKINIGSNEKGKKEIMKAEKGRKKCNGEENE
jgi:hypothetical protein